MELTKYEIFVQIMENGSLTRTAQKIGYTQSAISHMVSALEAELGVTLLVRSRSGVSLTPEGEAIFPYIQSISKGYSNLYEYANKLQGLESGVVRIGTSQSFMLNVMPPVVARFQERYPGIRLEFRINGNQKNFEDVVSGWNDVGTVCTNEPDAYNNLEQCQVLPLIDEPMLVIISPDHPAAELEYFPPELLHTEKFIMIRDGTSETRPIFQHYGVKPDVLFYMEDPTSIMAMVEHGLGISIIPAMSYHRTPFRILGKPLPIPARRKTAVIFKKQPLLSNAARAFVKVLFDTPLDLGFAHR